jgi:hypothetical protein
VTEAVRIVEVGKASGLVIEYRQRTTDRLLTKITIVPGRRRKHKRKWIVTAMRPDPVVVSALISRKAASAVAQEVAELMIFKWNAEAKDA